MSNYDWCIGKETVACLTLIEHEINQLNSWPEPWRVNLRSGKCSFTKSYSPRRFLLNPTKASYRYSNGNNFWAVPVPSQINNCLSSSFAKCSILWVLNSVENRPPFCTNLQYTWHQTSIKHSASFLQFNFCTAVHYAMFWSCGLVFCYSFNLKMDGN